MSPGLSWAGSTRRASTPLPASYGFEPASRALSKNPRSARASQLTQQTQQHPSSLALPPRTLPPQEALLSRWLRDTTCSHRASSDGGSGGRASVPRGSSECDSDTTRCALLLPRGRSLVRLPGSNLPRGSGRSLLRSSSDSSLHVVAVRRASTRHSALHPALAALPRRPHDNRLRQHGGRTIYRGAGFPGSGPATSRPRAYGFPSTSEDITLLVLARCPRWGVRRVRPTAAARRRYTRRVQALIVPVVEVGHSSAPPDQQARSQPRPRQPHDSLSRPAARSLLFMLTPPRYGWYPRSASDVRDYASCSDGGAACPRPKQVAAPPVAARPTAGLLRGTQPACQL